MKHTYIWVRTPRLNGKVERSHRTDKEEFYQLLTYTADVDLNMKLEEWQNFYNYHRPHSALAGKTPYVMLCEKLNLNEFGTSRRNSRECKGVRRGGARGRD